MLRSTDVEDTYKNGGYLRRWVIVDGQPRCANDAVALNSLEPSQIDAIVTVNAAVRERMAAVEAYEEAQRLVTLADGLNHVPAEMVATYEQARASIAGASPLTKAYAVVRQGRPAEPAVEGDHSPAWVAYQQALAVIEAAD
ncbi:hypothetical protein [Azospirillum rugosum]|uniref:Uncharacterized protein n=1 Tax=Azospirillum rugosum TaxID=416170 RepID=A0ABS4SG46_9PROT|nr:hypothetical protein [Azospirillum rugosum]MBP2291053.1 hypothetical protein [Azospirillum rugosum]MDQ0524883.1 hypothetical protein [Azospirillum rugosum]